MAFNIQFSVITIDKYENIAESNNNAEILRIIYI